MTLDDAITEIARARKRLEDDQGRLARKNARAALKAAVSTVLRTMDREYPLIRKERVVRVKMTAAAKERRARNRWNRLPGHTSVASDTAAILSTLGVTCVRAPSVDTVAWKAPRWAVHALLTLKMTHGQIRHAARSATERRRITALLRLKSQASPQP